MLAQEEARLLHHNYIGTEHILLGLIHEGEGVAAKALESLGISLEAVRAQVEEIIGHGGSAPSGHIPFTPRAKKVLELSLREALQLGHNYIGTEHILLGLIREGEGVAAQVLVKLGADLSRVRQQVIQLLSGYAGSKEGAPAGGGSGEAQPGGSLVRVGRYGPYLEVTLDEAIALLRARAEVTVDGAVALLRAGAEREPAKRRKQAAKRAPKKTPPKKPVRKAAKRAAKKKTAASVAPAVADENEAPPPVDDAS